MSLDEMFMPKPAGGRRGEGVSPLGIWEQLDADEARKERRREAWRKYKRDHSEECKARVAAWRARQKEAKACA